MPKPGTEDTQLGLGQPGLDLQDDGESGTSPQTGDDDVLDGPDPEAMAALFGDELEGQQGHEADEDLGQDETPGGDNAPGGQSGDLEWDKLSEADRKAGFLRHADYTRKTQEVAERRRDLEQYEQQLRQAALELQQAQVRLTAPPTQPQSQQQQPPPQGRPMKLSECVDELGQVDLNLLEQYEAQRDAGLVAELTEKHIKPVAEQLTAREQRDNEAAQLAVVENLEKQKADMLKAFPMLNEPDNLQRVLEYMGKKQAPGEWDMRDAFAVVFKDEFNEAYARYKQTAAKHKQAGGQAPPPATPPNRQRRDVSDVPDVDDHDAMAAAMEAELRRLEPQKR